MYCLLIILIKICLALANYVTWEIRSPSILKLHFSSLDEDKVIFSCERVDNVYVINLNKVNNKDIKCLISISHDIQTWYGRLGHVSFELLDDLSKHELMVGLPKIKFTKEKPCDAY